MANSLVQIRNVPEDDRRALKARAASRGESLNTFLLHLLSREVSRPTVTDVLERAGRRAEHADCSALDVMRSSRSERAEHVTQFTSP